MKIIDIHTHIYPDEIARKATDSVRDFYGVGDGLMDGTVKQLLGRGKEAGTEQFVILPVAIRPDRVQHINDFVQQKANEHSCFIPFGTVHAAMENTITTISNNANNFFIFLLLSFGKLGVKEKSSRKRAIKK